MKEVASPSGGPWGGTTVDENFVAMLKQLFGGDTIKHFVKEKPQAWLKLMTTFDLAKRAFKSTGNAPLLIDLGFPFCMEIFLFMKKQIDEVLKDINGVSFKDGYLVINHNVACGLFSDSITKIVKHVHSVMNELTAVKYVLLVGGYGMCDMFKEKCKAEFGDRSNILTPHEAQLAIVKGAVLFGHNPLQITSRIARFTYGTRIRSLFVYGVHNPEKKVIDDEGKERCDDCFDVFITKNEEVRTGEERHFSYSSISKEGKKVDFALHKVDRTEVMYTDETGVEKIGSVTLHSTDGPLSKSLEVRVTVGHTELLVEARDKTESEISSDCINIFTDILTIK